jgi:uncharacterized protein
MIISRYTSWAADMPRVGEALGFHYLQSSFVHLDAPTYHALQSRDFGALDARVRADLLDNGFLAESDESDLAACGAFLDELLAGDPFTCQVTVLTTFDCNFACVYCFEEHAKSHMRMDERTVDATCAWLRTRLRNEGQKKLDVCFYGGEPLMNTAAMMRMMRALKDAGAQDGFVFTASLITNGSLLTESFLDEAIPLGLSFVRVSADGRRAYHDARRPFKGGAGTYDLVMRNVRAASLRVPTGIAVTFDIADADEVVAFVHDLVEEGLMRRLKMFAVAPVAPRLGPQDAPGRAEMAHCDLYAHDPLALDALFVVYRALIEANAPFAVPVGNNLCPMITLRGGYVIEPDGAVGKCNALAGYPQFHVGSVFDPVFDTAAARKITGTPWEQCPGDCTYLPACQGGCRQHAFLSGDVSSVCCRRPFFDKMMPQMLMAHHEHLRCKGQ